MRVRRFAHSQQARAGGFTLLEVLVVVIMVGIVAAIAAPSWFAFLEQRRLSVAQSQVYGAIQQAQSNAQRLSKGWQFSIREGSDGYVEWATHETGSTPTVWNKLPHATVEIDAANTTLNGSPPYIRFDFRGNLESGLATLTLQGESGSSIRRCVIASTLLGHFRTASEQREPNPNGRYCY